MSRTKYNLFELSPLDSMLYPSFDMPAGQPTLYRPEYVEKVAGMCLAGATDSEIADELGVSIQTLYNWRAKHPEFLDAIRYGKQHADDRVERSLYHRAVGFEYPAVKISFDKDGNPQYAPYREYFPPDAVAAGKWLNNRRPEEWRDKSELNVTGNLAEVIAEARKRAHEPNE